MKYYLNLANMKNICERLYEIYGLIEISKDTADELVKVDSRLGLCTYDETAPLEGSSESPAFCTVQVKKPAKQAKKQGEKEKLFKATEAFADELNKWYGKQAQVDALWELMEKLTVENKVALAVHLTRVEKIVVRS
jgi:hypothetical protein